MCKNNWYKFPLGYLRKTNEIVPCSFLVSLACFHLSITSACTGTWKLDTMDHGWPLPLAVCWLFTARSSLIQVGQLWTRGWNPKHFTELGSGHLICGQGGWDLTCLKYTLVRKYGENIFPIVNSCPRLIRREREKICEYIKLESVIKEYYYHGKNWFLINFWTG